LLNISIYWPKQTACCPAQPIVDFPVRVDTRPRRREQDGRCNVRIPHLYSVLYTLFTTRTRVYFNVNVAHSAFAQRDNLIGNYSNTSTRCSAKRDSIPDSFVMHSDSILQMSYPRISFNETRTIYVTDIANYDQRF